jgi:hypothetical protein
MYILFNILYVNTLRTDLSKLLVFITGNQCLDR